jgi:hypothetical protein
MACRNKIQVIYSAVIICNIRISSFSIQKVCDFDTVRLVVKIENFSHVGFAENTILIKEEGCKCKINS